MAHGTLRVEAQPPNDEAASSHGHITFVDNSVDQTTGTIRIKATFPNDDRRLWPGQFVNVIVTLTNDPTAVVVPTAAVQVGQQGQYAFVVKPDKTVEYRGRGGRAHGRARNRDQERPQAGRDRRHRRPAAAGAGSRVSIKGRRVAEVTP